MMSFHFSLHIIHSKHIYEAILKPVEFDSAILIDYQQYKAAFRTILISIQLISKQHHNASTKCQLLACYRWAEDPVMQLQHTLLWAYFLSMVISKGELGHSHSVMNLKLRTFSQVGQCNIIDSFVPRLDFARPPEKFGLGEKYSGHVTIPLMYGNSSINPPTLFLTLHIMHMQYQIQHKHYRAKNLVHILLLPVYHMHNDRSYMYNYCTM